jgi:hypothetical protein
MSYDLMDFTESLERSALKPTDIELVVAAWGMGDGMGEDAGHYRFSPTGATDWAGGFLMKLRDGTYAYLQGWCDYTGWGCRDGIDMVRYATQPALRDCRVALFAEPPAPSEWDHEPADLNRWLANEVATSDTRL